MSRILFVIFLAFVFACTDQTEPPATTSRPDEVTLDDDASGIGLELSVGKVDREAHTQLSGGATTIFSEDAEAFENAAPNLSGE
ncbi:MAG TPA: hypothetical protein VFH40_01750, partial [Gemmatimonadales bacterium]|nr:hypothetical protein [Gemmatimonadales bacterium]